MTSPRCPKSLRPFLLLVASAALSSLAAAQQPAANLDQIRNGAPDAPIDPPDWVNGNAGDTNAHFAESLSTAYRVVMTNLPTDGTEVMLTLEYDVKHSDRHALDYLTHFQRLEPHLFGHPTETIDPRIGVAAVSGSPLLGDDTTPIPAPSSVGSPVMNQPTQSYNDLIAAEGPGSVNMTLYNGSFSAPITYDAEGDLMASNSSSSIIVTFIPNNATAVLAWGGHIGSREDWLFDEDGIPRSAGGISGSPYHMRLIDWNLNNLGNQDRSLKSAAVFEPCPCEITGPDGPVCPNSGPYEFCGPDDGMYEWSVIGDGMIVGSSTDQCVQVMPTGACNGSFTVQLTFSCGIGSIPSMCEKTVMVVDDTPPMISCPPDFSIQCIEDLPACDPNDAMASDDCGTPMVSCSDGPLVGGECGGTITRTFTAVDACGNMASCTQTITVDDTTPPMISCPPDFSVQCIEDVPDCDPADATASDNCATPPMVSCSDGPLVGGECGGTITRTFTAVDACGNMASCTQTITVDDTTPPMISCPPDFSVQCIEDVPACDPADATASDNCTETPMVSCSDGPLVGGECGGTITRTFTAVDDCGNMASCTQTITVDDTTPPMISCPPNFSIQCLEDLQPSGPEDATASDNCGTPMVSYNEGPLVGGECGGTITRTYTATDACGNTAMCMTVITVDDTTPPMISCPPNFSIQCLDDLQPSGPEDATASDNCGTPMVSYNEGPLVGGPCGGTITRTYTATDDCGNTAMCTTVITVDDTTPPMISCPPGFSVECVGDIPAGSAEDATASDNCGTPMVSFSEGPLVGGPCGGTVTRTYTATDDCGNTATCTQVITVDDMTPPMISCPPDFSIQCLDDLQPSGPEDATASDNCGTPMVSYNEGPLVGGPCGGTITRTYTAMDECGNMASCTTTITVDDTTAPEISCPTGCIEIDCREPFMFSVTASDNCDPDPTVTCMLEATNPELVVLTDLGDGLYSIELLTTAACGDVTVTCTAVDECGNESDPCTFQFRCLDMACRLTAGGKAHNRADLPMANHWSVGGQVGAPTHLQPNPCGEWTHRQHQGIDGRFTFHGGTASAPVGTRIVDVRCSDPGGCFPSGDPPSPAKDVDFSGIGAFKNIRNAGVGLFSQYADQIVVNTSLHWFEVHTEDLGEPGSGGSQNPPGAECPEEGTPNSAGSCSCPDFYRIQIYLLPEPPGPGNPLIYDTYDYLEGGNFQTHHPTNGGTCGNGG